LKVRKGIKKGKEKGDYREGRNSHWQKGKKKKKGQDPPSPQGGVDASNSQLHSGDQKESEETVRPRCKAMLTRAGLT